MLYTLHESYVLSLIDKDKQPNIYYICASLWSECGGGIVQALHRNDWYLHD